MQFVPEIARKVPQLSVFQRTGNWFLPRENRPYPAAIKAAVAHMPGLQDLRRFMFQYSESLTLAIRHPRTVGRLAAALGGVHALAAEGPVLRRRVWPDYQFGCKRVLFSSYFLPALHGPT